MSRTNLPLWTITKSSNGIRTFIKHRLILGWFHTNTTDMKNYRRSLSNTYSISFQGYLAPVGQGRHVVSKAAHHKKYSVYSCSFNLLYALEIDWLQFCSQLMSASVEPFDENPLRSIWTKPQQNARVTAPNPGSADTSVHLQIIQLPSFKLFSVHTHVLKLGDAKARRQSSSAFSLPLVPILQAQRSGYLFLANEVRTGKKHINPFTVMWFHWSFGWPDLGMLGDELVLR